MGTVVSRSDLLALVADARRAGRTVAFANGCFDLLHVGHVRYLAAAAQEADQLIVAINDDASVRALKGEGRPILTAADRAELVAALRFVDYVVVFPEPTVGALLEASDRLNAAGQPTNVLQFVDMFPLDEDVISAELDKIREMVVVEQNYTGQLAHVLRGLTGRKADRKVLKYDGRPMSPDEIVAAVAREVARV